MQKAMVFATYSQVLLANGRNIESVSILLLKAGNMPILRIIFNLHFAQSFYKVC